MSPECTARYKKYGAGVTRKRASRAHCMIVLLLDEKLAECDPAITLVQRVVTAWFDLLEL